MTLVEINDFSGMLNLRDAAYKLRPNEARDIRNIIASPSGEARLRGGYDLWGDTKSGAPVRGIHRFYTPTLMHLLAASGTGIVIVPMSLARMHQRKDAAFRILRGGPTSTVAIAWPRDHTTEDVETFVGIVRGRTANSSR